MKHFLTIVLMMAVTAVYAQTEADTTRHMGYTVFFNPAWQIAMDEYERKWLRDKQSYVIGAELNFLPKANDAFDRDYNYPALSIGAMLNFNHGVTMRRTPDPSWGKAEMVDYDSHLGNIFTLYGNFSRPLFRSGHWQLDYSLRAGIGYTSHIYNKTDNIDNELIGSAFNIYFGAGLVGYYQVSDNIAITAGMLYGHHSNGALARPNKGENHWGPMVGILMNSGRMKVKGKGRTPEEQAQFSLFPPPSNLHHLYLDLRLGVGGKTLLEDWQKTQFYTEPGEPDYRTDDFHFYMSYSASAAIMYRYARRWASGIGADVYYGTYYKHIRDMEVQQLLPTSSHSSQTSKTSPWSIGISARHEVYYHNLSLDMALGIYLHRKMGAHAKEVEQPYYERIGVFYTFPKFGNIKLGASVQAHRTKADLTELMISVPVKL